MSRHSNVIAQTDTQTDRHTHRQTHSMKTLPTFPHTQAVKIYQSHWFTASYYCMLLTGKPVNNM